jgi:AcrR family transcriptional regulator
LISAELGISPGNLYYHYPAKDELINALFDRYECILNEQLNASEEMRDIEDAWFFMHSLFELIWQYRFLYRDLNDLLSKNRRLETHFQWAMKHKTHAIKILLDSMRGAGSLTMEPGTVETTVTSMVVVLTYWLSFEYVGDPRHALEPTYAPSALVRGTHHVLSLLLPYLEPVQRLQLEALANAHKSPANCPV